MGQRCCYLVREGGVSLSSVITTPLKQLTFWDSPEAHVLGLHPPGAPGRVTIARRIDGRWREQSVPVCDLAYAVRALAGAPDTYITQNRFWGQRRRIAGLAQLDALFTDLDWWKVPALNGHHPLAVYDLALQALEEAHLPVPSVVINHGRGVAMLWLHTPVPRAALPRWNACQQRIYQTLKHLGADPNARDAARVLRLIGTVNSRTGVHVEALTPTASPWSFDDLADQFLPLTRGELVDLRIRRAAKRAQAPQRFAATPPAGFTAATLWESRLTDLQRLLELRQWNPLPPGHRDEWLFVAGVAMSWLAIPLVLQRELYALAHQVGGWDEPEAASRLHAVISRTRAAANGMRVQYAGMHWDPRYRFRTETIIERLEITPEEQQEMTTLIDEDLVRERHKVKEAERKRRTGEVKVDRATYEAQAQGRRQRALQLREQGLSYRDVAKALQCSVGEAHRLLQGERSGSVRLYGGGACSS